MTATIARILSDVPRGLSARFLDQQTLPQARWQSPEAVASSEALRYRPANPDSKILVGAIDDRLIGINDNRHMLTVAGSRSGKSVMLAGNLLHYPGSTLVLDPKGELATLSAARRAQLGQRVHVLDPFSTRAQPQHHRGPLRPQGRPPCPRRRRLQCALCLGRDAGSYGNERPAGRPVEAVISGE